MGTITFSKWLLALLWYGARNSANYRRFYINKHQRGRKKLVYKFLKVKCVKMFVFVGKKLAFVEATIYELLLCTKYKSKQTQNFSAGFVFNFLLFLISKLLTFLSQNENKQTTCSKIECKFCQIFACVFMFLFNLNDLTTVNFNKITLTIVKHFKILTNTISRLRLDNSKPIVTSPQWL